MLKFKPIAYLYFPIAQLHEASSMIYFQKFVIKKGVEAT